MTDEDRYEKPESVTVEWHGYDGVFNGPFVETVVPPKKSMYRKIKEGFARLPYAWYMFKRIMKGDDIDDGYDIGDRP